MNTDTTAPKKQRGGHKPPLSPEMALVTRGMRARPDEWARFLAIVDLSKRTKSSTTERMIFSRMIADVTKAVPIALRPAFERLYQEKLAEIVAENRRRCEMKPRRKK